MRKLPLAMPVARCRRMPFCPSGRHLIGPPAGVGRPSFITGPPWSRTSQEKVRVDVSSKDFLHAFGHHEHRSQRAERDMEMSDAPVGVARDRDQALALDAAREVEIIFEEAPIFDVAKEAGSG
jgi:hypothetical protein